MAESSLGELYQEIIEREGDTVRIHTGDCIVWLAEHKNCSGCPSELGCGKLVKMMLVSFQSMLYTPVDYNDFVQMQNHIEKLHDEILKAKTRVELDNIPNR